MIVKIGFMRRLFHQRCDACLQRLYEYALWTVDRCGNGWWFCPDEESCENRWRAQSNKKTENELRKTDEELKVREFFEGGKP